MFDPTTMAMRANPMMMARAMRAVSPPAGQYGVAPPMVNSVPWKSGANTMMPASLQNAYRAAQAAFPQGGPQAPGAAQKLPWGAGAQMQSAGGDPKAFGMVQGGGYPTAPGFQQQHPLSFLGAGFPRI